MGVKTAAGGTDQTDEEIEAEEEAARVEAERVAAEEAANIDPETGEPRAAANPEDDETVITLGDAAPGMDDQDDPKAPEWVKELRKNYRETQRELRELKAKQTDTSAAETRKKVEELGPKPKLADFEYKPEEFEAATDAWYQKKQAIESAQRQQQDEAANQDKAWQATLSAYTAKKVAMKVRDFDDAEAAAQAILSTAQQGIILHGAKNPAAVMYILGKNPKKAKEFAAISDPVKYAFAVADLETQVKVTKRKAPPPEERVQGNASNTGAVDSQLERLRAEAAISGDLSKVVAYRKQKREAARK